MKRWTEIMDVSDIMESMEMILLLEEGKDFTFTSTTKGGLGKVYKVKENGQEYITISSQTIKKINGPRRMKFNLYRHTILKEDSLNELLRIVVEHRL
jgi:hypothetical protein